MFILIFSACSVGVFKTMDKSFVICSPPIGITEVAFKCPFQNIAMVVEPPPISIKAVP